LISDLAGASGLGLASRTIVRQFFEERLGIDGHLRGVLGQRGVDHRSGDDLADQVEGVLEFPDLVVVVPRRLLPSQGALPCLVHSLGEIHDLSRRQERPRLIERNRYGWTGIAVKETRAILCCLSHRSSLP
jgi:hypothetical protein